MKKQLEALVHRVSSWPEVAQAELIERILEIESRLTGVYHLNDDERAAVQRGLEAAKRGEFATDEEVAAVFSRYR